MLWATTFVSVVALPRERDERVTTVAVIIGATVVLALYYALYASVAQVTSPGERELLHKLTQLRDRQARTNATRVTAVKPAAAMAVNKDGSLTMAELVQLGGPETQFSLCQLSLVAMIHPALAPPTSSIPPTGLIAIAPLACREHRVQLHLARRTRRLCVALVIAAQALCAVYLVGVGRLFSFLEQPFMTYLANLLAPASSRRLHLWGALHSVVAALHAIDLALFTAQASGLSKQLVSRAAQAIGSGLTRSDGRAQSVRTVVRSMSSLSNGLFGRHGLLGLDSEHFPLVFAVREALEVGAQCVQLQRSSELVTRPWISHALVALLVVNCWSAVALRRVFRGRLALERIACLTLDVLLNMGSSMAFPLTVFLPYALAFNRHTLSFPIEILYNDLAFTKLVRENRAPFALSWSDGVSKLIPHLATFSTLRALRVVLLEAHVLDTGASAQSVSAVVQGSDTAKPTRQPVHHGRRLLSVLSSVLHAALITLSVVVVALHARAFAISGRGPIAGCKQPVYPWFGSAYTCAIYEFNCYRRGVDSPPEHALDALDRDSLAVLLFTHCPALRVPRAIRRFPQLLGLEICNSTLVEWAADASIDAVAHARMTYLTLARVNMTALPEGLLQPLPEMLLDIEISVTNLTAVPDDLHERWHDLTVFYLEHSQLAEYPRALSFMVVDDLSLSHQRMQAIPALAELEHTFFVLTLAGNPLRELPETIKPGTTFGFVVLDDTLLDWAPAWLFDSVLDHVNLFGTPLCSNVTLHQADSAPTRVDLAGACKERDPTADGRYPLALVAQWRDP
ncbi:hypothetical protein ATCC90586_007606 [Pythium insidiosum]|nr:hypothetical protein ATCC90586_007606 [Pythium insidiosum]